VAFVNLSSEVHHAPRWNAFLAGLAIEIVGLVVLIEVCPRLTTQVEVRPIANTHYVTLVSPFTPPPAHYEPPRSIAAPPQVVAKVEAPRLAPRLDVHVKAPQPKQIEISKPEFPKVAAIAPPAKPTPPPQVRTNVFAAASETATVHQPVREIQTGGFGDPNGIAGQGDTKRNAVRVASLGSFDLPSGPGRGNGSGESHGVSGTIRSAGFSDESASSAAHGSGNRVVVAGAFGDVVASAGAAPLQIPKKPEMQPVEITYKPRPVYTEEARRRGVEGEVLLEVVFSASGSLHIKRVVKGLGYGLDDAALAAAQRIQFRPARRDGQPYDCATLVHMVFELAD
jgi:TonB family protein